MKKNKRIKNFKRIFLLNILVKETKRDIRNLKNIYISFSRKIYA